MKSSFLFILITIFIANTIMVSAWAQPCPMDGINNQGHEIELTVNTDMSMDMANTSSSMPCHDAQESEPYIQNSTPDDSATHCDGVCLCLNASLSQVSLLDSNSLKPVIMSVVSRYPALDEFAPSRGFSPPYRPPIYLS